MIGKVKGVRSIVLLGGGGPSYTSYIRILLTLDTVREQNRVIRLIIPIWKLLLSCLTSPSLNDIVALRRVIRGVCSEQAIVLASVGNLPYLSHACH